MDKRYSRRLIDGGSFLHAIFVGYDIYIDDQAYMFRRFLLAYLNMRSLSVVERSGLWASEFAVQLEQLEVAGFCSARIFCNDAGFISRNLSRSKRKVMALKISGTTREWSIGALEYEATVQYI